MIDIQAETLIPVNSKTAQAFEQLSLPRPSVCTLWRWRNKGVRGRKLESVTIGGRVYTSIEAIARFAEYSGGHSAAPLRTSSRRAKEIARAEQELAAQGI